MIYVASVFILFVSVDTNIVIVYSYRYTINILSQGKTLDFASSQGIKQNKNYIKKRNRCKQRAETMTTQNNVMETPLMKSLFMDLMHHPSFNDASI